MKPASLRYDDPGRDSPLDFAAGDSITLEAWVNPAKIAQRPAGLYRRQGPHGQSGLRGRQSELVAAAGRQGRRLPHLVPVSRRGQPPGHAGRLAPLDERRRLRRRQRLAPCRGDLSRSARAIRSAATSMAARRRARGTTAARRDEAPVVDDDQVWIGSAVKNSAEQFVPRRHRRSGHLSHGAVRRADRRPLEGRAAEAVRHECADSRRTRCWSRCWKECRTSGRGISSPPTPSERFTQRELAFVEVPKKYNNHGVIDDRSQPVRPVGSCRTSNCPPASSGCSSARGMRPGCISTTSWSSKTRFQPTRPTATIRISRWRARSRRAFGRCSRATAKQVAEVELAGGQASPAAGALRRRQEASAGSGRDERLDRAGRQRRFLGDWILGDQRLERRRRQPFR